MIVKLDGQQVRPWVTAYRQICKSGTQLQWMGSDQLFRSALPLRDAGHQFRVGEGEFLEATLTRARAEVVFYVPGTKGTTCRTCVRLAARRYSGCTGPGVARRAEKASSDLCTKYGHMDCDFLMGYEPIKLAGV